MPELRKRYRVLILAAFVAAFVVRVGFALSIEPSPAGVRSARHVSAGQVPANTSTTVASWVLASSVPRSSSLVPPTFPDAVKLLLVGTALIGLGAVVRKAD